MKIYSLQKQKLSEIKENPFKLEREIQNLFENKLDELMGLTFVKSEFSIKNKRIDTLAFDRQTNAFVIIEVKRDKNLSVVDQGFTYLSLMLENKADFIVEYNECLKGKLTRDDIDWHGNFLI
jgi:RecB family endonuclease NucS